MAESALLTPPAAAVSTSITAQAAHRDPIPHDHIERPRPFHVVRLQPASVCLDRRILQCGRRQSETAQAQSIGPACLSSYHIGIVYLER